MQTLKDFRIRDRVRTVTPVYSVDLFGICSLLYELGGLIVMHDASGCNSTYATHDEPRWYDIDSMIYISGLTEYDAVLGNDDGFINDVLEIARERDPRFIAVFGSPVAMITGTDFHGIARIIEKETGIPAFGFDTSGMHTYNRGAAQAMLAVAERFLPEPEITGAGRGEMRSSDKGGRKIRVNLLGVTPLDFSVTGNAEALKEWFCARGFDVLTTWCMGNSLDDLYRTPEGDVDVVCSSMALPAAKYIESEYGIPYVTGLPCGTRAGERLRRAVTDAAECNRFRVPPERDLTENGPGQTEVSSVYGAVPVSSGVCHDIFGSCQAAGENHKSTGLSALIIGEPVLSLSLSVLLEQYGIAQTGIIDPLDDTGVALRPGDIRTGSEEETAAYMREADLVIADPVYGFLLPGKEKSKLIPLPHEACSGRMFRKDIPVLIGNAGDEWLKNSIPADFRKLSTLA